MTESEVRAAIVAAIRRAGSLRALARSWGVSPSYLSDVRAGRRGPGESVLGPLGLVRIVTVEYLPGEPTRGEGGDAP